MSDRVAFISSAGQYVVVGTHGPAGPQIVGKDHFPFLVYDYSAVGSPPEQDRNNIALTLDRAMQMFLRVRKWRLNVTGVLFPYPPGTTFNVTGEWEIGQEGVFDEEGNYIQQNDPYTLESQMVLGRPEFLTRIETITNTGAHNISLLTLDIFFNQLYFNGSHFFPSIYIEPDVICATLKPGGSSGSIGSFTINLSGGVSLVDPTGTYSHNGAARTADTTLTAIEWWPYATKPTDDHPEGEDVYDIATGAQLRDPLS